MSGREGLVMRSQGEGRAGALKLLMVQLRNDTGVGQAGMGLRSGGHCGGKTVPGLPST